MARPVTLFTGQWADLPFEEMCKLVSSMGYDGVEIATWGDHMDVHKAASDPQYVAGRKAILDKYGLKCWAISAHLSGQCIGDLWDSRLDGFAPANLAGKPEEIRKWAIQEMKYAAVAAKNFGLKTVTSAMGSPIWAYWYSVPHTTEQMLTEAYAQFGKHWTPIFDEFDKNGIRLALEIQPGGIVFDYYSADRFLKEFKSRKNLGFCFNPSSLIWQGLTPHLFIRDFQSRIFHVHMKDVAVTLDGRAGLLGSFLPFGDVKRAWNFRSLGHGDVDFENIIRELNAVNYKHSLSVVWEDSSMNREVGAKEACDFMKSINFSPLDVVSDETPKAE